MNALPEVRVPSTREEVIKAIKAALERRSGKKWSVTGGRGTAYGWLHIDAPPKERTWHRRDTGAKDLQGDPVYEWYNDPTQKFGYTSPARRQELAALLGKTDIHCQGENIPASTAYYMEYLDRAETGRAEHNATPYWD